MSDFGEKQQFILFNAVMLTVQCVTTLSNLPGLNFDFASHGNPNIKLWSDKVTFQANNDEICEIASILMNGTGSLSFGYHGSNKDKLLSLEYLQNGSLRLAITVSRTRLFFIELSPPMLVRLKAIVFRQLSHILNCDIRDCLLLLRNKY